MLRQIIVTFVWLLGFFQQAAEARDVPAAAQPVGAKLSHSTPRRGALFRVSHADHTLFLFGTIHVGRPDFFPLEATLMQALAQSSKIALELDPSNLEESQKALQKYGFFPEGQTLKLAPVLEARLKAILKKQGMPFSMVERMKPWMLTILLAMNEYAAAGYQATLATDLYFSEYAQTEKKSIVELEGAAGQMSLFGKLSMPDQMQLLEDSLNEIEDKTFSAKLARVTRLWREADALGLNALSRELADDQTFSGKFMQRELLEKRNPAMVRGVEKLLKSEKKSVAGVGILHLVGDGSIPQLLRRRGYAVERIY
jgi:uncharacterized protein YbaP (TraB family)